MIASLKNYKFDEFLVSHNIEFFDREIVSIGQNIRCDRCNAMLKYVNILKIDEKYFNIGDCCYQSVKNALSELRGKSLYWIRRELEGNYERHVENKTENRKTRIEKFYEERRANAFDSDYNKYLCLKWDMEHNNLPDYRLNEYEELRKRFNQNGKGEK